jgi:iron(III) transport system permease protein
VTLLLGEHTVDPAGNSLLLGVSVAAGAILLGVPTAWLTTRVALPWPTLWRVLAALPLALPSYVAAYAWLTVAPGLHGYAGSVLVLTLVCTPYVTLPVAAALRRVDADGEDVARTLGRGPVRAALSTRLPQVAPAAAAGALLAGLYALSDFGAVALMRFPALTSGIQVAERVGLDPMLAAVLALLLAAMALAVALAGRLCRGRARLVAGGGGPAPRRRLGPVGTGVAVAGLTAFSAAALGVPAVALVRQVSQSLSAGVAWDRLGAATSQTLALGAVGAALTVLLALPIGILAGRYRGPAVTAIESVSSLGNVIPGIVVGLALVLLTATLVPGLHQTSLALAVAYAVMFLPHAVGATRSSVQQVPPEAEQVARTLGRTPRRVWSEVTARIAAPGIATGGLLVMLTAMKELPATLLLRPTGVDTLATELWSQTSAGAFATAAPYAATLVVLAALPAYLLSRPARETRVVK